MNVYVQIYGKMGVSLRKGLHSLVRGNYMTTYEFVNHRFTIPDGLGELTDFIPSGLIKTYLDQLQEWFIIVNSELRIVYANQKAKNWFETEIEGKTIFDVFHISEQQSIIVQVFHTGEPVLNRVQTYYDSPHGKLRASIASTYPVVRNNQVIGVIELGEDVTGYNNLSEQIMHNLISDMKSRGSLPQKRAVRYTLDSIVGESHVIHEMKDDIVKAANSHASVLICGETGTGKELVAQSIYALGNDPNAPFIAQNCAAIPESLLEGMLFGTVKGAYTGAETRTGLFELANNGILFLDEINSMPLSLQAKILRVLEEKKLRRLGAEKEITVNFRLVAAVNADPYHLVQKGELRSDLYYRLNVLRINVPPLRLRKEDIPLLADAFIKELNTRSSANLSPRSLQKLMGHSWPGNVRELRNVIERALHHCDGNRLDEQHLRIDEITHKEYSSLPEQIPERLGLKERIRQTEIGIILETVDKCRGNIAQAARELDIPQQTLDSKIKKYVLRDVIQERYRNSYR